MPSKLKKAVLALQTDLTPAILTDLRALIAGAQTRAAVAVNRELVLLYWDLAPIPIGRQYRHWRYVDSAVAPMPALATDWDRC